jgi:Flp pilus assembly protein TadB
MSMLEVTLVGLATCGLALVLSALPAFHQRPSLEERLRRFNVDARLRQERAARFAVNPRPLLPWPTLEAALRPLLEDLVAPVQRLVLRDGIFGSSIRQQLQVVEPGTSRQAFVGRQLAWAIGTLAVFVIAFFTRGQLDATHLLLSVLAGAVGFVVPWLRLRHGARRRARRVLAELPHVARLLAMGMSASLPLDVALVHVGQRSHGPLGQVIRRTLQLAADRTCDGLLPELARRADLENVPELSSFVGLLQAADAQGLPLAPSLETMATTLDQRAAARLLATAERGTVKMLFPLALVLMPVVVMVALVPALLALYALVRGG